MGRVLAAGSATLGLVACGGGSGNQVVARVRGSTITKATLQSSRAALAARCARQYRTLSVQALDALIYSRWLIGEAADEGLSPPQRQVAKRVAERQPLSPGGTDADVTLQVRAELAAAAIRQELFRAEPQIAPAQVAQQYGREIARFRTPERRDFEIFENIPNQAAAVKVMGQIAVGRRHVAAVKLHESLPRPSSFHVGLAKGPFVTALFAARPHVLTGPVPLNGQYALFDVTKITPAGVRSPAQVEKSIRSRLTRDHRRRTLARFVAQWRRKWTVGTDCARGYVVPKCRQYSGPRSPEDPLALK